MRGSPLARLLFAVYVLLSVYASLYPFSGWRDPGAPALAFLFAGWPRYFTAFDFWANVFGYLPYGLLCAAAAFPALRGGSALLLAAVSGAAMSLALEAAQSFLATRVASNLDVLANVAGACAGGVLGAWLAPTLLQEGRFARWRAALFERGLAADVGLTLVVLWLFSQLNPATLLFGSGDLRDLLAGAQGTAYAAKFFAAIEAAVAAANLAACGLLASALLNATPPARVPSRARNLGLLIGLVALALLVKTFAFAIVMRAENVLAWLTPGAQAGLAAGIALALAAFWLPRSARLALAAVLLMAATVLVNLAPPNPYLAASLKVWQQGHFLNFNGLTHLVSAMWPFAALGYLVSLAAAPWRKPLR